jgi:hypothetical protein
MKPLASLHALALAVELGLVIGKGGRDISEANAEEHISGYSVYNPTMSFQKPRVNTSQLSPLT